MVEELGEGCRVAAGGVGDEEVGAMGESRVFEGEAVVFDVVVD